MKATNNFDEQFNDAMKSDPGYSLPDNFADRVAASVLRKLAFRVQMRNFGRYVVVLLTITLLNFLFNYVVNHYYPKYDGITINGFLFAGMACFVLFILFMDKVVLSFLGSKSR